MLNALSVLRFWIILDQKCTPTTAKSKLISLLLFSNTKRHQIVINSSWNLAETTNTLDSVRLKALKLSYPTETF